MPRELAHACPRCAQCCEAMFGAGLACQLHWFNIVSDNHGAEQTYNTALERLDISPILKFRLPECQNEVPAGHWSVATTNINSCIITSSTDHSAQSCEQLLQANYGLWFSLSFVCVCFLNWASLFVIRLVFSPTDLHSAVSRTGVTGR